MMVIIIQMSANEPVRFESTDEKPFLAFDLAKEFINKQEQLYKEERRHWR